MTLFLALLLALVVSALVLALLLRLAPRTGLMDHPGERRRIHREAVPRVGGLAIFAGLLVSLVVAPPLTAAERYGLAGAALLVLVGALDDRYQLGPRVRLLAQLGAGLLLTLGGGVVIPSLGDLLGTGPLGLGAWAVPFTLVAVVGLINALNMIDGIDGLAAGVTVIAVGGLWVYLPAGPLPGLLLATLAALVPGTYSPLAPLADDWVPALDHRHLVVAAHLLGYAGLVVLLTWLTRRLALAVAAILIFSSALELIQVWLPWREGSWEDLAVNLLAVAVGALLVWLAERGGLALRGRGGR